MPFISDKDQPGIHFGQNERTNSPAVAVNRLSNNVEDISRHLGRMGVEPEQIRFGGKFLAKVLTDSDFSTDERYSLQISKPSTSLDSEEVALTVEDDYMLDPDNEQLTVVATNLAEVLTHTHAVPEDSIVEVTEVIIDRAEYVRMYFFQSVAPEVQFLQITGAYTTSTGFPWTLMAWANDGTLSATTTTGTGCWPMQATVVMPYTYRYVWAKRVGATGSTIEWVIICEAKTKEAALCFITDNAPAGFATGVYVGRVNPQVVAFDPTAGTLSDTGGTSHECVIVNIAEAIRSVGGGPLGVNQQMIGVLCGYTNETPIRQLVAVDVVP